MSVLALVQAVATALTLVLVIVTVRVVEMLDGAEQLPADSEIVR